MSSKNSGSFIEIQNIWKIFGNNSQQALDAIIKQNISKQEALDHSFSGVMLRGSGIAWDLRKSQPYECYKDFNFKIPIGKK